MFRGLHNINLDSKGRLAVPSKYRDAIAKQCSGCLVVTIDPQERCLLIYPVDAWEALEAKLEALSSLQPAARRLQRLLIGYATDIELDSSGRMLLSQPLRDYAGLDKEIVLMGQSNKLELWDKRAWEEKRDIYINEAMNEPLPAELLDISL